MLHRSNVSFESTAEFDGAMYQKQKPQGDYPPDVLYDYYGIIDFGLPYADNTAEDFAYQPFRHVDEIPDNSTIEVDVQGFYPKMRCVEAQHNYTLLTRQGHDGDANDYGFTLGISSPGHCPQHDGYEGGIWMPLSCDPTFQDCPEQEFSTQYVVSICDNSSIFSVADVRYHKHAEYPSTDWNQPGAPKNASVSIANITAVVCYASYQLIQTRIQRNITGDLITDLGIPNVTTAKDNSLVGFGVSELANVVLGLISSSLHLPGIFALISIANNNLPVEALLNSTLLAHGAEKVFKGIAIQYAASGLLAPGITPLKGNIEFQENRLQVSVLTMALMCACFLGFLCTALVLLFHGPRYVASRDPDSMTAVAAILAASPKVAGALEGTGSLRLKALERIVSAGKYQTVTLISDDGRPRFRIERVEDYESRNVRHESNKGSETPEWWCPVAATLIFRLLVFLLPVAAIIVLEVLQRISDRDYGFANAGSDSNGLLVGVLTGYVPALYMITIGLMFASINFATLAVAPYHALKKGCSAAHQTVMSNPMKRFSLFQIFESAMRHQWGPFFSSAATVAAAFLTIMVSGLYTTEHVKNPVDIVLYRQDSFNLTWSDSVKDDQGATLMFNLNQDQGLSYPKWTYDELVLPAVGYAAPNQSSDLRAVQGEVSLQIPALRATLNCSALPSENYNLSMTRLEDASEFYSQGNSTGTASLMVKVPLPPSCHLGGPKANLPYIQFDALSNALGNDFGPVLQPKQNLYLGSLTDLHLGLKNSQTYSNMSDIDESFTGDFVKDNPEGCPSLAFTFGEVRYLDPDFKQPFTVLVCYQLIQEIQTNVSFQAPKMTINPDRPPVALESTARTLANGSSTNFRQYRIQSHFDDGSEVLMTANSENITFSQMGNFYEGIVLGPNAVDPASLVGEKNVGTLVNVTTHVYRQYMAQAINSNMRQPLPSSSSSSASLSIVTNEQNAERSFTAFQEGQGHYRVVQHKPSKLALQALLGFMVFCGIATYATTNMGRTVMHKPTTIAGVASLLAGSRLLDRKCMPEAAEWMSEHEMERDGAFEGWMISLGWWDEKGVQLVDGLGKRQQQQQQERVGQRFGIDIDIGAVEAEPLWL